MKKPITRTMIELEGQIDSDKKLDQIRIVWAKRTTEQQHDMVKAGVSETMDSEHLDHGDGANAVDIVQRRFGSNDATLPAQNFFRKLGLIGQLEGLEWGGEWKNKNPSQPYGWDPGHLQKRKVQ